MVSRSGLLALALAIPPAILSAPASVAEQKPASTRPTTAPARKVTLEEFDRMRKEKDAVVLDVRTAKEFGEGHVAGAVNVSVAGVPLKQFDEQVGKLDKDKTYLVHCARGVRSAAAVSRMQRLGFKNLLDYSGGMDEWRKAGKPLEK
jgi:rhodanese-related sulfurtransferase